MPAISLFLGIKITVYLTTMALRTSAPNMPASKRCLISGMAA